MATLNKDISVLAAILNDISNGSDINFIYILSAKNVNNATMKNTLKQTDQMKSQFVYKLFGHLTKAAGIKVFLIPKKWECSEQIV